MLQKLYTEFGEKRMMPIGIFINEDPRAAGMLRQYAAEHHVTFPLVIGDRMVAVNYLGISPARPTYHVPTFFFVAPDGRILEERDPDKFGNQDWFASLEANLETTIRRLIPPEAPAKRGKARPAAKPRAVKPAAKK